MRTAALTVLITVALTLAACEINGEGQQAPPTTPEPTQPAPEPMEPTTPEPATPDPAMPEEPESVEPTPPRPMPGEEPGEEPASPDEPSEPSEPMEPTEPSEPAEPGTTEPTQPEQPQPSGEAGSDQQITQQVRSALQEDQSLSEDARMVEVQANQGVVTLSGQVASEEERDQLLDTVWQIEGVQDVVDELQVRGGGTTTPQTQ